MKTADWLQLVKAGELDGNHNRLAEGVILVSRHYFSLVGKSGILLDSGFSHADDSKDLGGHDVDHGQID